MAIEYLQNYWWFLISVLGGILVFLLFVQGGQSMLPEMKNESDKSLVINSMGRKWELTFTTLVTFGGAAFASFPLFYSTSFGGAYWLWILILFSFVGQAVSYEYRSKPGNVYGRRTFDALLFINGCFGCLLLGVAVSMFFFGGEFSVNRGNLVNGSTVISQWAPTHGFEAIFNWKNLVLGVAVVFLARTQSCLYMMNNISSSEGFFNMLKGKCLINAGIFVVFFLWFLALLFTATGYTVTDMTPGGRLTVAETPYKYFINMTHNAWEGIALLTGVVLVVYGIIRSVFAKHWTKGIWYSGIGTFLVVASLFWAAGYDSTPFYPSLTDPSSSLSIRNASSSRFTLECMSYVSILIPFVLGYIAYVWRAMDLRKLSKSELDETSHKY